MASAWWSAGGFAPLSCRVANLTTTYVAPHWNRSDGRVLVGKLSPGRPSYLSASASVLLHTALCREYRRDPAEERGDPFGPPRSELGHRHPHADVEGDDVLRLVPPERRELPESRGLWRCGS